MKRGYKQNRLRNIWKSIKRFYEIADDYNEFTELCCSLYYSSASADVEMPEFLRMVKAVKACY
jgi:hypothetical protein